MFDFWSVSDAFLAADFKYDEKIKKTKKIARTGRLKILKLHVKPKNQNFKMLTLGV